MATTHIGSWGTPEFGITEKINDLLGYGRDASGGSGLVADAGQTVNQDNNIQWNALQSYMPGTAPTPVSTPRVQSPSPVPVNTNTGGGGGFDMKYYPGWGYTEALADWNATGGAKANQGGGQPDYSALIEQMYGPAFNSLTSLEGVVGQQRDVATSGIQQQAGEQKSAFEQALMASRQMLGNQVDELSSSLRKGESSNLRNYKGALQQMASRFGAQSSTGVAASEIILSEFLRSGGDIRESYAAGQKVIQQKGREYEEKFQSDVKNLEDRVAQGIKEIDTEFQSRIQEIGMRKADLETNKTAMRIEALQSAVQRAQQLDDYKQKTMFDLGVWNLERKTELGQSQAYLDDLTSKVAAELKSRQLDMTNTPQMSFLNNGVSTNNSIYKSKYGQNVDDPYSGLLV